LKIIVLGIEDNFKVRNIGFESS